MYEPLEHYIQFCVCVCVFFLRLALEAEIGIFFGKTGGWIL